MSSDRSHLYEEYIRLENTIANFFLSKVEHESADSLITQFENLFILARSINDKEVEKALAKLIIFAQEDWFHQTLKRCGYILLNYWLMTRQYEPCLRLINCFNQIRKKNYLQLNASDLEITSKQWLISFIQSSDFQDFKSLIAKHYQQYLYGEQDNTPDWLIEEHFAQSQENTDEQQREDISLRYLDKYAYIVDETWHHKLKLNSRHELEQEGTKIENSLYKQIILPRYKKAEQLQEKMLTMKYQDFKQTFNKYLLSNLPKNKSSDKIADYLQENLLDLYSKHDEEICTESLILRTSNKLIDQLTTKGNDKPSENFIYLIANCHYFVWAKVILKIFFISRGSYHHLNNRLLQLIKYYENIENYNFQWLILFLETNRSILAKIPTVK